MQENLGTHSSHGQNASNYFPKLAGHRPNLNHGPEATKRFKPNTNSSRSRPFLNSGKEDSRASAEASKYISDPIQISAIKTVPCTNNNQPGHQEGGDSGSMEEGESEDGGEPYLKKFKNVDLLKTSSTTSASTTPFFSSVDPCETITELDLAQETSHDPSSEFEDLECPFSLDEAAWKELLERLRQEKGFMCSVMKYSSEGTCLNLKCAAGHSFTIKTSQKFICRKCEEIMAKCSEYAELHHGNNLLYNFRKTIK